MATHFSTLMTRSSPASARRVEPRVLSELRRYGYSEQAIFAVRLALAEALANAIHHGNHGDVDKHIRVEYCIDGERAVIRVGDEGEGFSRCGVPDPTQPENLEKPSGRGIMLMEAFMNEVRWNDRGNQVEMVKRNE